MQVKKFDLTIPVMEHYNPVYYLLLTVIAFKMVPYHAEKYNILVDFDDISFRDIPILYLK